MELKRFSAKNGSVLGVLLYKAAVYFTLEPEDNLLPEGAYNIEEYASPKNGKCLLLWNDAIPKSRGFEIHAGNSLKDTAGCILVGNACSLATRTVLQSKKALQQLLKDHNSILVIGKIYN